MKDPTTWTSSSVPSENSQERSETSAAGSDDSKQVPMSEASLREAAKRPTPPWPSSPHRSPVERFDNRMWYIRRSEMLGSLEEHELEALEESARARLESELEQDHRHRKVADQYLSRIRRTSGQ